MSVEETPVLRLGVMCNGTTFPQWQADCLQQLLAMAKVKVEVSLLIIEDKPTPSSGQERSLKQFLPFGDKLWTVYNERQVNKRSRALWPTDMSTTFSNVPKLSCQVLHQQKFDYFKPADLTTIRHYNLDIILQFGFGELDGEILTLPRYGVWSFCHYDLGKEQAGLVGFWEIYRGEEVTEVALQRLTPKGGRIVLQKGTFATVKFPHVSNLDLVYLESTAWPTYVCRDIALKQAAYLEGSPLQPLTPHYRRPNNGQMLFFQLRIASNRLDNLFTKFFRQEQWNVGIVNAPIEKFLLPQFQPEIQWLAKPKRNCFVADPFIVYEGEKPTLLLEAYDYRTRKGWISALENQADGSFSKPKTVLELPIHLSYPYPIKYKGEIYCVPETYQAHEVGLYKASPFPEKWVKVATLVKDFAAVDTTVFEYEGRWWLLCTKQDGSISQNVRLFAWYASDLMGPWQPHAANPIKADVRASRPGGTPFVSEGQLYRPSQDCSHTYGGAITINRVVCLTPDEFKEELAIHLKPDPNSLYPDGLHTLSAAGKFTVVDGKRTIFVWAAFQEALKEVFQRRFKRNLHL
ncbi:MAG: hypothetical protein WCS37_00100 [Chloroflexota bacterium]